MPATPDEPETTLTRISPMDVKWHRNCAEHIRPDKMPDFWEDRMLVNPAVTYMWIFNHPENFVVDVNGDGVIGFQLDPLRMRAWVYSCVWGPKAKHRPRARWVAAKAAFQALEVYRIEAITRATNLKARKACEEAGMHFNGLIRQSLWYNKKREDAAWFELDRERDFGLPPAA